MVTTVTDNSPQSINTSLFAMDSEIQKVKKTTDALNDKLSGIDTESGVISVNGKQGIVELNASDVDALPSSTVIPTTTSELTNNSGFITSSDSITGNAATATTADKVKNALTVNGKTYDGSSAIDAGVQTIANGGTGQTTQADINKAFVSELLEGTDVVTDSTMFVSSWASDNGFADTHGFNVPYKRKFSRVWEYIKGKISSVLGLTATAYGGNAATATRAENANKIIPNYTSVALTEVTSYTIKYIHLADYSWSQTGALQVYLRGNCFEDTLVINFGGGNSRDPMLCGHYSGNSYRVYSVIAQRGPVWNSGCSIYVKVGQETNLTVNVALLTGSCTISISDSTTAPTDISEWSLRYGLFGNIASPEITSLEQRVAALESRI